MQEVFQIREVAATPKATKWRPFWPVLGGFIFSLTFGVLYTFGNLSLYIISYMRWSGEETRRVKDFSWVYSVALLACVVLIRNHSLTAKENPGYWMFRSAAVLTAVCSLGLMMFCSGMLQHRMGIQRCALLGASLFSCSLLLSAYTVRHLGLFTLTFGVLFGISDGLSYSCPIAAAQKWWPHKKGLMSGIVLAGTSLSPLLFGPLQSWIVNPQNKAPTSQPYEDFPNELYFEDEDILARVPLVFLTVGIIAAIFSNLSAVSLVDPPSDYKTRLPFQPSLEYSSFQHISSNYPKNALSHDKSPSQIISTTPFWVIWFLFLFYSQCVIFLSLFWKIIGLTEFRISDKVLSIYGNGVIAIGNTVGRLFWGMLADRVSTRVLFCSISGAMMLLLCCYAPIFTLGHAAVYFLWIGSLYFCIGGVFVSIPTALRPVYMDPSDTAIKSSIGQCDDSILLYRLVRTQSVLFEYMYKVGSQATSKIFGLSHFSSNYGVLYTARVVGAMVSAFALAYFYERCNTLQLSWTLALCALLCVCLSYFLREEIATKLQD